jgi:hypothetical protein
VQSLRQPYKAYRSPYGPQYVFSRFVGCSRRRGNEGQAEDVVRMKRRNCQVRRNKRTYGIDGIREEVEEWEFVITG